MRLVTFIGLLVAALANLDYKPTKYLGPLPEYIVRSAAEGIHVGEVEYQEQRSVKADAALTDWLRTTNIDFDPEKYNSTIGLAFSGGGYRAMLLGAGQLSALDSRSHNGELAGLLQSSSYLTGLSGGSWLVGSLIFNGFPTIDELMENKLIWNLEKPLFSPPEEGVLAGFEFYTKIMGEILKKKAAGFSVTITDIWGRMLMRQLIDQSEDHPWLWSQLKDESWYRNADAPFPIITTNSRTPITQRAHIASQIFEVTPIEIGTFDSDPYAFTPLEFLGTAAYKDVPYSEKAYTGLDNAGFILGISSSLFDQMIVGIIERITNSPKMADWARKLLLNIGMGELRDVGVISPNPFYEHQLEQGDSCHNSSWSLYLADGGSNKQNIPIQPLLHPDRQVDVVMAFDNGGAAIDCAWPDGFSMSETYSRQFKVANSPPCASIPDQHTMVNLGLVERPTFFGCYASNMSNVSPLIVYVPNEPYSCYSNSSTFQLVYSQERSAEMIENGFNTASMGNGTVDPDWATCVACAVTQRSRERAGDALSDQCRACFDRYCWDGSIDADEEHATKKVRRDRERKLG